MEHIPGHHRRKVLRDLMNLRRDKRYRLGLLEGAVNFNVISQAEFIALDKMRIEGVRRLPLEL